MYVILVNFLIKPELAGDFRSGVLKHANNSLTNEPGCQRFEVSIDPEDSAHFLLYEVYDDRAAFELHTQADYFAAFGAKAEKMVISKELTCWETCAPA